MLGRTCAHARTPVRSSRLGRLMQCALHTFCHGMSISRLRLGQAQLHGAVFLPLCVSATDPTEASAEERRI